MFVRNISCKVDCVFLTCFAETRTSPIPSSKAPQIAEPPVGRAARLLTFFSPLLLDMLLLFMWYENTHARRPVFELITHSSVQSHICKSKHVYRSEEHANRTTIGLLLLFYGPAGLFLCIFFCTQIQYKAVSCHKFYTFYVINPVVIVHIQ